MKKLTRILLVALIIVVLGGAIVVVYVYNRLHQDVIELEPVSGDLAFISDRNGNWDIFILKPDGTLINVTEEGEGDDYLFSFTFSSDMIYFYTNRPGEFVPARVKVDGSELEVMNFITAATNAFSSGHFDVDPTWSPDGRQLAWAKMQGFSNDICLSSVDDVNDFHCVTQKQGGNFMVSWSPDGTKLAYASDRTENQSIFVADIESGEQTQLTHDEGWDFQPVWSLDGSEILFISNREDDSLVQGKFDLYLVKPDGSDLQPLAEGAIFKGDPVYSPSGEQVAFMSNEDGNWHIYLMDADGSNVRRLTDGDSNNMFPVWVPKPAEEKE